MSKKPGFSSRLNAHTGRGYSAKNEADYIGRSARHRQKQHRRQWRALAQTYGAVWQVIECICSDEALHRQRLTKRDRGIPGWPELDWTEVERVKSYYAPWQDERLILDAVNPLPENITAVLSYIQG